MRVRRFAPQASSHRFRPAARAPQASARRLAAPPVTRLFPRLALHVTAAASTSAAVSQRLSEPYVNN